MFNSLGRSSNFAQAGKSAADETVKAFAASRRNSTNFGELTQKAANLKSQEKIAAMKAESQVTRAGIDAATGVEKTKINIEGKQALQKGKRKAGALAAAGQLFGNAGQFLGEKRTKRTVGSEDAYFDTQIEKAKTKGADFRTQAENVDLTGGFVPMEVPKLDIPGSSNDSSSGTSSTPSTTSKPVGFKPSDGTDAWSRLSKVIRYGEGTSGDAGYTTQFTGTQFNDTSKHPRQIRSSGSLSSDAAGAYQFLSTTWDEAKGALNLTDFSPASQEKAGQFLAQRRGVDTSKVFTNIDEFRSAMDKLAPEWASLPYSGTSPTGHGKGSSYYGQGGKNINELWAMYNS
jgi:muramidase (phage lysozyme)